MAQSISFHKLFAAADKYSGLSQPLLPPQEDTTEYESLFHSKKGKDDQEQQVSRFSVSQSDIDRMRIMTKTVELPETTDLVMGVYAPDLISEIKSNLAKMEIENNVSFVDIGDWMSEVRSSMVEEGAAKEAENVVEYDEEEGAKGASRSARKAEELRKSRQESEPKAKYFSFERQRKLEGPLVDYRVFRPDLMDLQDIDDPLDSTLPNVYPDEAGEVLKVDSQGQTVEAEQTKSLTMRKTNPIRAKIFERHASHQRPPSGDLSIPFEDDSMASKFARDKARKLEKAARIKAVQALFDTTQTLIRSANKRNRDVFARSSKAGGTMQIAALNHSSIATSHQNSKADLFEVELKYFHRPRMIKERDRPMILSFTPPQSVKKAGQSTALSRIVHSDQDRQNLSLNNDHPFILLEYVEENPPVMLNWGMASAMLNYFRSSTDQQEDEEGGGVARKKTEHMSNAGLAKVSKVLEERNCRLPRHVMMLLSLKNYKRPYEYDASIPRMKLGQTKVLSPDDESPFLGDVEKGEVLPSLSNNLFRAPLFQHHMPPSDFLLIRTKLSPTSQQFVVREIPHLFLVGQMEPQRIVPRPARRPTTIQDKYFLLSMVRQLQAHADNGLEYAEAFRGVLKYCSKEKEAPHKGLHRERVREIIYKVADEVDEADGTRKLYPKEFRDAEMEYQLSLPVLCKSLTPEEVCLQESSAAAEYRLFQQHVTDIDLYKLQQYLQFMHKVKEFAGKRYEGAVKLTQDFQKIHHSSAPAAMRLCQVLERDLDRIERKLSIARFIYQRLLAAPWNTTEAYVKTILEREGGRMMVQGMGDPSGRGEGFALVMKAKASEGGKKESVKLVGTDKDLRKITKIDAINLLVSLGVNRKQAEGLKRWDRVHMIREMINKLDSQGQANEHLQKYVRDPNNNNMAIRAEDKDESEEVFKKTCQQIWERQKAALRSSARPTDFMSKDARRRLRRAGATSPQGGQSPDGSLSQSSDDDDGDDDEDIFDIIGATERRASLESRRIESSSVAPQGEEMDVEKEEYSQLNNILTGLDTLLQEPLQANTEPLHYNYPRRVVRRLVRRVHRDGSEQITVQFLLDPQTIRRVELSELKAAKDRQVRRDSLTAFTDSSVVRGRGRGGLGAGVGMGDEDDDDLFSPTISLTVGKTKKTAANTSNTLVIKKGKRKDEDGELALLAQNKSTKRLAGVGAVANLHLQNRLPRVCLAARLEKELLELWKFKNAHYFWSPVDAAVFPSYYQRIAQPICLSDIREKIARLQYSKSQQMVEDFELMSRNAEQFNGSTHLVAVTGRKLLEALKAALAHERVLLGPEKDTIAMMEGAIARKMAMLSMAQQMPPGAPSSSFR